MPLLIRLTDEEKHLIANMAPDDNVFAVFPETKNKDDIHMAMMALKVYNSPNDDLPRPDDVETY